MSLRNRGLVFAMEEGEVIVDRPEETTAAAELEVEQSVGEIVEQTQDTEDLATAIEEAVEDADTLEGVQEIMADSVEEGEGLPEEAAEMAEVAVESICRRLGIRGSVGIPAMESFGSKNTRLASTKIAMESVWEKVKTVWETIKKAIINLGKKVMDIVFNLLNNAEKLGKLAAELKTKAEAVDGEASEKEIKNGSLAKALTNGTKADASTAEEIVATHAKLMDKFKDGVGAFNGVAEAAGKVEVGKGTANVAQAFNDVKGKLAFIVQDVLTNNSKLEVTVSEGDAKPTIKVALVDSGKDFKGEALPTLDKTAMLKLIDSTTGLITKIAAVKKDIPDIQKANKALVDATDTVIKFLKSKQDKDTPEDAKKDLANLNSMVVSANTAAATFISIAPTSSLRAAKSSLTYVSKSISLYKKAA